nr:muscular LMNA-interacting protein isoform X1 [Nothobranchius furzeri]
MESLNKSVEKDLAEVPAGHGAFTFVPVMHTFPTKVILKEKKGESLTAEQNAAVSHERTPGEAMSEEDIFKAEMVFIRDFVEAERAKIIQLEAKPQKEGTTSPAQNRDPSLDSPQSENTPYHAAMVTVPKETAANKHRDISQQQWCHDTSGHSEDSLGCFANRASLTEDRASPTSSIDLFPTPASSRESILSEGMDKDRSWSGMWLSSVTSPTSLSRTVSPCSSIRSGVFSPAVVQIKKHVLAPGSSLVNISQTCSSSCDSLSSACPQTPPMRHRPPLTRLSLLTAILRKGRLPVLSSALQRPYTPCWPVNPVTLSFCNACSAASSVASIPLELSSPFSSTTSIDSQNNKWREPNRSITAPPAMKSIVCNRIDPQTQLKGCSKHICSSGDLRQKEALSPPSVTSSMLPQHPQFSNIKTVSSPRHEKPSSASSPNPKLHASYPCPKDHNKNLVSPAFKHIKDPETRRPNSSLSKLQMLSQQLRSPPISSPQLQPSQSRLTPSPVRPNTAPPLPCLKQNTKVGGSESERFGSVPRGVTPSQAFHKTHLSPSRYKPIVLSGWSSPSASPTPTPSPAPPIRDFTPSPSLSLRSTPSPRPGSGISDCSDWEVKKRKTHKIKLSYKSLAAIPTNTLLLDQQAIDEQVENEQNQRKSLDIPETDTHAEMCSPAELRQKSEELYAVIDEILANSNPEKTFKSSTKAGFQLDSSLSKSLGRETKYASLGSLHLSANKDKKLTGHKKGKPGLIRPMTAIPRLTVKEEKEFYSKLSWQLLKPRTTNKEKVENVSMEEARTRLFTSSEEKVLKAEMTPERTGPFSVCELHIKEPDEPICPPGKEAVTSFSSAQKNVEAFEACI